MKSASRYREWIIQGAIALGLCSPIVLAQDEVQEEPREKTWVVDLHEGLQRIEGHGPCVRIDVTPDITGTLFVYARSEELDPMLDIKTNKGGPWASDMDSGGGTSAFLMLNVRPDWEAVIYIGGTTPDDRGQAELLVMWAPDTPDSVALSKEVRAATGKLDHPDGPGAGVDSSELLEEILGALDTTAGADHSLLVFNACDRLAEAALRVGELEKYLDLRLRRIRFCERFLPPIHLSLQRERLNAGYALTELGRYEEAGELERRAFAVLRRTVPPDHDVRATARANLARTLAGLGDMDGAMAVRSGELAALIDHLPADDRQIVGARLSLANLQLEAGFLEIAEASYRRIIAANLRAFPEEHEQVQKARHNLAVALKAQGDLQGGRAIEEKVLEVRQRTLPAGHEDLVGIRQNLGGTLFKLGDIAGARDLFEQAIDEFLTTDPLPHDPHLLDLRSNLAALLKSSGDDEAALEMYQSILAAHAVGPDHPSALGTRQSIAAIRMQGDDPRSAVAELEEIVALRSRTLAPGHADQEIGLLDLALALIEVGDLKRALDIQRDIVQARDSTLPAYHSDRVIARHNLLWTLVRLGDPALQQEAIELCQILRANLLGAMRSRSPRELEALAISHSGSINLLLSIGGGLGGLADAELLEAELFRTVEAHRACSIRMSRFLHGARQNPELVKLMGSARATSQRLAALVRVGASRDELAALRRTEESLRKQVILGVADDDQLRSIALDPTVEELAAPLEDDQAFVGYSRYRRFNLTEEGDVASHGAYLAHVLRASGQLQRVELGTAESVVGLVSNWRSGLGVMSASVPSRGIGLGQAIGPGTSSETGRALRVRVFDGIASALLDVARVSIALDGDLHLIPFDALPTDAGVLGDEIGIRIRSSAMELAMPAREVIGSSSALIVGGIDYGADLGIEDSGEVHGTSELLVRSGGIATFGSLPGTLVEAEEIAQLARESLGDSVRLLTGSEASTRSLLQYAPGARFLHLATHGWFAPQMVDSVQRDGGSMSLSQQVRGTMPMVLCGLAFAGVNNEANAVGHLEGALTARELANLDLTRCDLAVLSACETNVGFQNAGQGVASLQKALHMAGARSVVTSLWKVPDEATRELMVEFYRRLWVLEEPRAKALWEAKRHIRTRTNAEGRPLYTTRDWAGWVLTGDG